MQNKFYTGVISDTCRNNVYDVDFCYKVAIKSAQHKKRMF